MNTKQRYGFLHKLSKSYIVNVSQLVSEDMNIFELRLKRMENWDLKFED